MEKNRSNFRLADAIRNAAIFFFIETKNEGRMDLTDILRITVQRTRSRFQNRKRGQDLSKKTIYDSGEVVEQDIFLWI